MVSIKDMTLSKRQPVTVRPTAKQRRVQSARDKRNAQTKLITVTSRNTPVPSGLARQPARSRRNRNTSGLSNIAQHYLASILYPCSGNARIPDLNCLPTGLVTCTAELQLGVSAAGSGGIVVNMGTLPNYNTENLATTTDLAYTFNAATNFPGAAGFSANWQAARVVSACLDFMYVGTTLTDSGILIGSSYGSFNGVGETQATSVTTQFVTRCNETYRVPAGISVVYRPSDLECFNFRTITTGTGYGALQVHITGANPLTVFKVSMTINYEAVPTVDSLANSTGATVTSPSDPIGLGNVLNRLSHATLFNNIGDAMRTTRDIVNGAKTIANLYNSAKDEL